MNEFDKLYLKIVNKSEKYPNRNGYCFCAACRTDGLKVGSFCNWISPNGKHVCFYGVCSECFKKMIANLKNRESTINDCERWLLEKYPFIKDKLPVCYTVPEEGSVTE